MNKHAHAESELAHVIRKLERDGDEHGVAEVLHDIGNSVAELIAAADEAAMRLSLAMSHSEDLVAHMRLCAALARIQGESP